MKINNHDTLEIITDLKSKSCNIRAPPDLHNYIKSFFSSGQHKQFLESLKNYMTSQLRTEYELFEVFNIEELLEEGSDKPHMLIVEDKADKSFHYYNTNTNDYSTKYDYDTFMDFKGDILFKEDNIQRILENNSENKLFTYFMILFKLAVRMLDDYKRFKSNKAF